MARLVPRAKRAFHGRVQRPEECSMGRTWWLFYAEGPEGHPMGGAYWLVYVQGQEARSMGGVRWGV